MSIWSSGWYYADGEFTISSRVAVEGEINLILCDGAQFDAGKGIDLAPGSHLIIWGQNGGTGRLSAYGDPNHAGIGGGTAEETGSLTINGGRVSATGGAGASALGSAAGDSGIITINGGAIYEGEIADNSALADKTLRPYDGMGVTLTGRSISLQGDIAVNYYMELSPEILSQTGVYMQFSVPDTSPEYQDQKVYVDDLTPVTLNGKNYYVFKCRVAAKNMTSEIRAQLIDGDNKSVIYTYSVKEYADYLIEHADEREDLARAVPLVKAMLNYGANAQIFFDKNPETLANANLSQIDKQLGEVNITEPGAVFDLPEGVTFGGATISLKSVTSLSLYFKCSEKLSFSVDGKTVETASSGGYQIARIRGIPAKELKNSFTLHITAGEASGSVTYSPMNYCYNVLNDGTTDVNLINVVKALYLYAQAADEYFPD